MASEIAIIKVLAPIVTPQQFAELEGVSYRTARRWTTGDNPRLPIEPRVIRKGCKRAGGQIRIYYARWKRIKCVRHWVIPVFNSSSAINSLYVNCKDAAC